MRRLSLRTVFLIGLLVGLATALLRALNRPAPPGSAPLVAPPPPLPAPTRTEPELAAAPVALAAAPTPADPAPVEGPAPAASDDDETPTWVAPVENACPVGFPVKVKVGSGIFHRPGGLSYERTRPDRCYPDEASATADGFRAAKR